MKKWRNECMNEQEQNRDDECGGSDRCVGPEGDREGEEEGKRP